MQILSNFLNIDSWDMVLILVQSVLILLYLFCKHMVDKNRFAVPSGTDVCAASVSTRQRWFYWHVRRVLQRVVAGSAWDCGAAQRRRRQRRRRQRLTSDGCHAAAAAATAVRLDRLARRWPARSLARRARWGASLYTYHALFLHF